MRPRTSDVVGLPPVPLCRRCPTVVRGVHAPQRVRPQLKWTGGGRRRCLTRAMRILVLGAPAFGGREPAAQAVGLGHQVPCLLRDERGPWPEAATLAPPERSVFAA